MRAARDLGARLLLDLLGGRGRRILFWRGVLGALALGLGVCAGAGRVCWAAEAELCWGRVEEACLDAGEGALGEEVYAVDDLVEEGLRRGIVSGVLEEGVTVR